MKRQSSVPPPELLAGYADSGLTAEENDQVSQFLDENPQCHDEVIALREMIARVRQNAPRPGVEPDWSQMAADIGRTCDEIAEQEGSDWWSRLRLRLNWLVRPRYAIAATAVAAIIVVLAIQGTTNTETADNSAEELAPIPELSRQFLANLPGLDTSDENDLLVLDEIALDGFSANLADEFIAADGDSETDDSEIDGLEPDGLEPDSPLLSAHDAVEWAELSGHVGLNPFENADPAGLDSDLAGDLPDSLMPDYLMPDYMGNDGWLGDLSEEELDAIATYLETNKTG